MTRVMVLGGYGAFGERLSRRLAHDGWQVLVAGRNIEAAAKLAAELSGAEAIEADRNEDMIGVLRDAAPFLLIDAAGPFQGSDYRVARACIAAGIHYVDLADGRDFVCGIGELDRAAHDARVAVIAGASSMPALSGAVISDLARGLDRICSIDMSISASSRATAGASVAAAILSYVGRPVQLWRGRVWRNAFGWSMLRHEHYAVAGQRPLRRLVALADVPDHGIWPDRLPGRPATSFRAGPEFDFQVLGLWLLGWAVRWRWIESLTRFRRMLLAVQRMARPFGSERSAMKVKVKGWAGNAPTVREWTLIADRGDGPEIPVIAAPLVAAMLRRDECPPGARDASDLLALDAFRREFAQLAITEESQSRPYAPLYRRVMGSAFETLPQSVRTMHEIIGDGGAIGRATVRRGNPLLARLVGWAMRFPPAGDHAVTVTFEERDGLERWTRDFSGYRFSSVLGEHRGRLVERFGPMRFSFDLPRDECGLVMAMRGWSIFGIPMPLALAPRSRAREWTEGEDFCFDVPIALPLIGLIVHYSGRLRPL